MLIDIHLHLQEPILLDRIDEVMSAVRAGGPSLLLCNGTTPADWLDVSELADRFPEILPCFGVHPWYVEKAGDAWEIELRDFLSRRPSAIGECGLDRWLEPRDEELQERIFRRHLQLAHELDLPIMIHVLRAWDWFLKVLKDEKLPRAFLLHSYGGPAEIIEPLRKAGAYFSFSGNIHEEKRHKLREALRAVPRDRLLLETDAPAMLPPAPWRTHQVLDSSGQPQNHPANLPNVYAGAAHLLRCDQKELEQQVEHNARTFLRELFPS